MLKIEFTDDAKDYILQNGGSITVDMVVYGGCGGQINEPAVSTGKPFLYENYDLVDANGIKAYIFKDAVSKPEGIKISLEVERKVFKKLYVSGLLYAAAIYS